MPQGAAEIETTLIPVAKAREIVDRLKDREDTDDKVCAYVFGLFACFLPCSGSGRSREQLRESRVALWLVGVICVKCPVVRLVVIQSGLAVSLWISFTTHPTIELRSILAPTNSPVPAVLGVAYYAVNASTG